ncbi:two component transcriptional regulator, winged helix family [Gluconacetobacter diazotrophicus PA1 5]|uniref:winged helix-turn-helix domain-containing protein n=1 Tax=Gluconacetobacter diazotrophicus TaxID=33996 RepID=UPI000173C041|nr:response regulator transcription factor [Gluconacetobacter diazotrophicus]ACI51966.1 two component transcriptional regulator, winged helix family [Gluconacetobacter diazotrophicus PA1 5]
MRILIIEDEAPLGSAVQERLRRARHAADWFTTLGDARAALAAASYDVLLLDLGLPDGSGRDLLREIRRNGHGGNGLGGNGSAMAILITTAQDQISDRIAGLSDGADDYIVKPYDFDELLARLDAVSRRYVALVDNRLALGEVEIDLSRRRLSRLGAEVDLTAREWAVIELLARRAGAICSREQIEDALYGLGEEIESNAIEVFISRVRKKVGAGLIRTVRGRGYRLAREDGA